MEILIALFLLGLVCALIKVIWEYLFKILKGVGFVVIFLAAAPFVFVANHWRSFAVIISLAIVGCTVYLMFPVVYDSIRESRESEAREIAAKEAEELREKQREHARRERAHQEQEVRRIAEEERQNRIKRMRDKEDRIRVFAIKENPSLWSGYQALGGSIEEQSKRVENLKQDLVDFDKDPNSHAGYLKACKALEAMRSAHDEIRQKLEAAYLESRAFEALPERGKERAIGCINEAEGVLNRYRELSQELSEPNGNSGADRGAR